MVNTSYILVALVAFVAAAPGDYKWSQSDEGFVKVSIEEYMNMDQKTMESEIKSRLDKITKTEKKYKKNYKIDNPDSREKQEQRNWMEKWDKMNKLTFRKKLDEIYLIQAVCREKFGRKACPANVTQDWMDDRGDSYRNKFKSEAVNQSSMAVKNNAGKANGRGSYMGGGGPDL